RDRRILSEHGIFVAGVTINRRENRIDSPPKITSRGFVYVKTSKDLIKESSNIVTEIVQEHLETDDFEYSKLKQEIPEK
ncbi:ribonuclease J, partial [Enterococcus faecalis]